MAEVLLDWPTAVKEEKALTVDYVNALFLELVIASQSAITTCCLLSLLLFPLQSYQSDMDYSSSMWRKK